MAKITKECIQLIVKELGGASNINLFGNCMTRLRLTLHDQTKLEQENLKSIREVLGVICTEKQIQVVLGPGKAQTGAGYLAEILGRPANTENMEESDTSDIKSIANAEKNKLKSTQTSAVQQFLAKFATTFTPLIPGFIAAGLLLGIGTLIEQTIGKNTESIFILGLISYLKIFSKGMFTFMSILIGYNANKAFGGNGVNGAILASFFILGYTPETVNKIYAGLTDFFSLTIDPRGNIVGVLISAILAAKLETKIRRYISDNLDMVLTSAITLLIMGALTFIAIMPIGVVLYNGMTWLFTNLSGNPIGGAILAGLFLVSVMFGIHQGFVPVYFALVQSQGFNSLFPILAMAGAGQVGAALALYIKARKHSQTRLQILGAIIPGFLGVGEPLIYGVTLPRIKPFITACCGGAVGGLFIGLVAFLGLPIGLNSVFGPSGLMALPLMTSSSGIFAGIGIYLLGLILSYLAGFLITYLWGTKNVDLS